ARGLSLVHTQHTGSAPPRPLSSTLVHNDVLPAPPPIDTATCLRPIILFNETHVATCETGRLTGGQLMATDVERPQEARTTQLAGGSIGLPQVLFQSAANMSPAGAVAFSL